MSNPLDEILKQVEEQREDMKDHLEKAEMFQIKFKKWCSDNGLTDGVAIILDKEKNYVIATTDNRFMALGMAEFLRKKLQ